MGIQTSSSSLSITSIETAHESALAGHQGTKRTTDRTLEAFYWPGILADVNRFVSSCDIWQLTVPKGKVGKVGLGKMPIIDTPFERVAVNIISPLSPPSLTGKRYILTVIDFATRYPDAVVLDKIDSASIVEGLLQIFSRVGFPHEILCDRGSSFTSGLMREVNDLLSIRQMRTTPYHPMSNGLVERFNGTLKQMLRPSR